MNGWTLLAILAAFVVGVLVRGRQIARLQDDLYRIRYRLRRRGIGNPTAALREGSVSR